MKNKMKQKLNRELSGVRVSDNLKERILAEAVASRAPSRRRSYSIRPLAIAAAVMVVCGLTAGMIALRKEKPDLHATPLSAANGNQATWVWVGNDGLYHGASICGDQQSMSRMKVEDARAEGRKACSACIESGSAMSDDLVWMNGFGGYYHAVNDCSGMEGAFGVLEIEAKTLGRTACPACFDGVPVIEITPMPTLGLPVPLNDGTAVQMPEATWTPAVFDATPTPWATAAATGEPVEMVESAPAVTAEPTPSPMAFDATQTPWATAAATVEPVEVAESTPAVTAEPTSTPEPTSVPTMMPMDADISVWMTGGGVYCHAEEHCSGMEGAMLVSLKHALLSGKEICPVCMERTIWIDEDAQKWHWARNCSGMDGAQIRTLQPGEQPDLEGCPVCAAGGIPVRTSEHGSFYHWDELCTEFGSGKFNELQIMESEALKNGRRACPNCMTVESGPVSETFVADGELEELYVWATEHGVFYHSNEHCSGMSGAAYMAKNKAIESGKMRCESCMKNTVWVSGESVYYHIARYCSGMKDAFSISEQEALDVNLLPCPGCIGENEVEETATEAVGDSVWVKEDAISYHSDKYCASLFDVDTARGMGKAACAVCAENVSEDASVWLNEDKHFHLDKHCSELPAATEYSESEAVESGKTPCALCVENAVWMTDGGVYYHVDPHCSGTRNAFGAPEVNAEAMGKQACPVCIQEMHTESESTHHAESEQHH